MRGVSWGIFAGFLRFFEIFLNLEANSRFFVAPEEPRGDFPDLAQDFGPKVYRVSESFGPALDLGSNSTRRGPALPE